MNTNQENICQCGDSELCHDENRVKKVCDVVGCPCPAFRPVPSQPSQEKVEGWEELVAAVESATPDMSSRGIILTKVKALLHDTEQEVRRRDVAAINKLKDYARTVTGPTKEYITALNDVIAAIASPTNNQ